MKRVCVLMCFGMSVLSFSLGSLSWAQQDLVPDKHMPDWLAGVSAWNPLTLTVDAWRGTLLLGQSPSLFDELLPLLVFACFACSAAVAAMKQVARV